MFQKTIIDKYMNLLDKKLIEDKYNIFQEVYGNPEKQANIRSSKEEEYQTTFICDLFCTVLGYTIKPEPNFNILRELKNESKNKNNARKSDGAIVINGVYKAVIELKGTDTTDLDGVARQAFDYKSHHEGCNYVIISNFEKLRLYVETQTDFEEFNLFKLTKEQFAFLYLLLALPQIEADIPLKLKHETLSEEKEITNNFYTDYSTFKRKLFEDLCENNPDKDKLLLFKKTQKLLDRILFILFCEDRNLLPVNTIIGLIKYWQQLKLQPLYDFFKIFFERINTGFVNEDNHSQDVFAYNGGLFKPDEILDNVRVGNDVLYDYLQKLANYDFDSQISVDILGHIFEHSLTEIEEIQNQIEAEKNGTKITRDNDIGKRKKDGVFYTPAYITQYIVENTIGRLCDAKKEELKINNDEFVSGKKYQSKKLKELDQQLVDYRTWLLSLKILDPACGSGAFLNAALRKLRNEHKFIDGLWRKIHQDELYFDEIDNTILENNIYGVDINEESIEIAKLSLWLNTAKKNRKLTTLNDKIKCGNSLIDDKTVAGEKAFDWKKEFPEVFEKGGFDVVIGNPPYVPTEFISEQDKNFYEKKYKSAFGRINIYPIFYEKGISLLRDNGFLGFITPYTLLKNQYYIEARRYILENTCIYNLVDFTGSKVFEDATVDSIVLILNKSKNETNSFEYICEIKDFVSKQFNSIFISQNQIISNSDLSFSNFGNKINFEKLYFNTLKVSDIINFKQGIITGNNKKFITKEPSDITKKVLTGADFNKYQLYWHGDYIIYNEKELHRPRTSDIFEQKEKILLRQTGSYPICMIDTESYYTLDTVHNGKIINDAFDIHYLLTLLNSKLLKYIYTSSVNETGKVFAQVKIIYIDPLPIKNISSDEQQPFITLANKMLSLNSDLQKKTSNFLKVAKESFNIEKPSTKLETFYDLTFEEFIKELKQKITPKIKLEWLELFEEQKTALQKLKEEIAATDRQINSLVYKLYGLTEEEIATVEKS